MVGRSGRSLAVGVSYVVNPLVLPPVLISILLLDAGASPLETIRVCAVAALLLTVLPAGFLWWLVRIGRADTVEVLDRPSRLLPYLFGIACGALLLAYTAWGAFTAASLIFCVSLCLVANTGLMMFINRRWKISIHAAGIAGFIALLLTVAIARSGGTPPYISWMALSLPLVMWARVRSGAHTGGEVIGGALFGLAVPPLQMFALHLAGLW